MKRRWTLRRLVGLTTLGWTAAASMLAQDLRYLSHQAWGTEEGLPQNSVHAVVQGRDGYLWVATEGGLARFDGVSFRTYGRATDVAFESDDVCCLKVDVEGSLLVGTASGWLRMRDGKFEKSSFDAQQEIPASAAALAGRVQAVLVDREGFKWVGMRSGLQVVDPKTGAVQEVPALAGDSVLCLFEDAEGNHWVGTETSGLHVLRRLKFRSEAGLAGLAVTSVAQASDGAIWIGTRDDGLRMVKDGVVSEPVPLAKLTSGVVLCLAPADNGVWVGTPDGLDLVSAGGVVRKITSGDGLPDDYVRALARGSDGDVWVGTGHGLALVRRGSVLKVLTEADGLKGDGVGGLLFGAVLGSADTLKRLWVAGSRGASVVVGENVSTQAVGAWLHGDAIAALAQDEKREVWAVTEHGMLGRLNGEGGGLAVDFGGARVLGMSADGVGNLWLRMDHGVWRVRTEDLDRCVAKRVCAFSDLTVARYGRPDGLPNDEAVAGISAGVSLSRDGELWFPTRRGMAVVDARHLPVDTVAPPVAVERMLVDDESVSPQGAVRVPYGRHRLTVEYAGLSFTAPTEVRYRVKLEGFDKDWVNAGAKRSATYTNLAAGPYTFRVQAVNGDGVWNYAGAEVSFRVVPPFWRRWWFVALVVAAILLALGLTYWLRLRRLRRDFNVVLAERNRMAREIHDTLTQDFVGASLQLDLIAQHLKRGKVEAALDQVVRTRRLVSEGLDEARRSIWELRAAASDEGLAGRLRRLVEREEWQRIGVALHVGGAYRELEERVEREVLRVAQESLTNVVRHAGATETRINLHYSDEAVLLTIEDNGVGFRMEDAAAKAGHYGLIGMRERAAVADGELEVWSEVGKGTKVTLRVGG